MIVTPSDYTMKKILFIFAFAFLLASCKKDDKISTVNDKFLASIKAGQIDGIGIKYVDFMPDKKLVDNPADSRTANLILDLNNDSIDDFELLYKIDARSCCYSLALTITPLGNSFVCDQKSDTTYVEALAQGDIIDNSNNWLKSKTYLFYYWYSTFPSPDGTTIISEEISGSWYNQDNIYVGVKIIKDGKELFGWIDVKYLGEYTTVVRQYAITKPY
jgi:hypothetical protein